MKKFVGFFFISIIAFVFGWFSYHFLNSTGLKNISTIAEEKVVEKPLEKYSIENHSETHIESGKFELKNVMSEEDDYSSYLFSFEFEPALDGINKTTTGQINLPIGTEKYPIAIMLRGYVDQELYKTGYGTWKAAGVFAENGFITIAPDFLGYAGSSEEAGNIFETRFQTYVTTLSLIESLDQIDAWDRQNIFIWAHSNGGQIALTALEINVKEIPTTLWAPVTESFPYNILYYTNEAEDRGKLIRTELAKFEELYDVEKYAVANYFDKLKSPIQIHQGTNDDAIPLEWTYRFLNNLKSQDIDYTYYEYPGADHNMLPNWDLVVERDLVFFNLYLENPS